MQTVDKVKHTQPSKKKGLSRHDGFRYKRSERREQKGEKIREVDPIWYEPRGKNPINGQHEKEETGTGAKGSFVELKKHRDFK